MLRAFTILSIMLTTTLIFAQQKSIVFISDRTIEVKNKDFALCKAKAPGSFSVEIDRTVSKDGNLESIDVKSKFIYNEATLRECVIFIDAKDGIRAIFFDNSKKQRLIVHSNDAVSERTNPDEFCIKISKRELKIALKFTSDEVNAAIINRILTENGIEAVLDNGVKIPRILAKQASLSELQKWDVLPILMEDTDFESAARKTEFKLLEKFHDLRAVLLAEAKSDEEKKKSHQKIADLLAELTSSSFKELIEK